MATGFRDDDVAGCIGQLYNTNLDLFSDFAAPGPRIDWRSTLSWRLTPELLLDYKVDLLRLPP